MEVYEAKDVKKILGINGTQLQRLVEAGKITRIEIEQHVKKGAYLASDVDRLAAQKSAIVVKAS